MAKRPLLGGRVCGGRWATGGAHGTVRTTNCHRPDVTALLTDEAQLTKALFKLAVDATVR